MNPVVLRFAEALDAYLRSSAPPGLDLFATVERLRLHETQAEGGDGRRTGNAAARVELLLHVGIHVAARWHAMSAEAGPTLREKEPTTWTEPPPPSSGGAR